MKGKNTGEGSWEVYPFTTKGGNIDLERKVGRYLDESGAVFVTTYSIEDRLTEYEAQALAEGIKVAIAHAFNPITGAEEARYHREVEEAQKAATAKYQKEEAERKAKRDAAAAARAKAEEALKEEARVLLRAHGYTGGGKVWSGERWTKPGTRCVVLLDFNNPGYPNRVPDDQARPLRCAYYFGWGRPTRYGLEGLRKKLAATAAA